MTNNQTKMIDTIKLLIYKENTSLLEKVDFEDDNIFLEPLLFAYFNKKKENKFSSELLSEIMQGYFVEKEPLLLNDKLFDDFGFKYYNGWYCPFDEGMDSVTFLKIFDGYAVTLGNHEVEDLVIRYFHEMQAVIYGLKKVLV